MDLWGFLNLGLFSKEQKVALEIEDVEITYHMLYKEITKVAEKIISKFSIRNKIIFLNKDKENDVISILLGLASNNTIIPLSLKNNEKQLQKIIGFVDPDLIITDLSNITDRGIFNICSSVIEEEIEIFNKKLYVLRTNTQRNMLHNVQNPALIVFTSGTIGNPKGVELSELNIIENLKQIESYFTLSDKEIFLIIRQLNNLSAITGELLYGLYKGIKITLYKQDFHPKLVLKVLEKSKCTITFGTPTMFYLVALHNKHYFCESLKQIILSGEYLQPEIVNFLKQKFKDIDFMNVYGLSEASPRVAALNSANFYRKVGSVGKLLPGIECNIIMEDINLKIEGQNIGEVYLKGPNIFNEYFKDTRSKESYFSNGYLRTGDLGYIDEENYLYIIGRKDTMLNKAGNNIIPEQIESFLIGVKGIREAYVWGEQDLKQGLKIYYDLVLDEGSKITADFVRKICYENLNSYMWPYDINFVNKTQKSNAGKILRSKTSDE